MSSKICCIFNYPPHYRKSIYEVMDSELSCHFYFGDRVPGSLKRLNVEILNGFQHDIKNKIKGKHIVWQTGMLKLLFNKQYKFYITTVDTASLSSWIFNYLARIIGKKVFLWTHGTYGNETFLNRMKRDLFFAPANGLLLYGEYAKNILITDGYKKEKLHVIANSLDYYNHLEIRKKLQVSNIYKDYFKNDDPVIIFIGRLEKKKQLWMILDSMAQLSKKMITFNCVFVGEGSDKTFLSEKTETMKLKERVWFYGACYNENEIGNLIYNADLCVSPGNVGLTAMHCLSFGTPVITHSNFATQMPEFESIESGKNGDFFTENSIESLCDTLQKWFDKHPKKNQNLINKCYEIIDNKYNPQFQLNTIKKALQITDD